MVEMVAFILSSSLRAIFKCTNSSLFLARIPEPMNNETKYTREGTADDIAMIQDIAARVWPQTYEPIVGVEQVKYMLDRFYTHEALLEQLDTGHRFRIAYTNGEGIGFASFSEIQPGVYKLHKLYVAVETHGKGMGLFLMNDVVTELRKINAQELRLNVNRYNSRAIQFYERYGFSQLYTEDIEIGLGYQMNDYVYGLTL